MGPNKTSPKQKKEAVTREPDREAGSENGQSDREEVSNDSVQAKQDEAEITRGLNQLALSQLPPRPGYGTEGRPVKVATNHFTATFEEITHLWVYPVKVRADYKVKYTDKDGDEQEREVKITPRKMRRILWLLLKQTTSFDNAATDYAGVVVSVTALTQNEAARAFPVVFYEEFESPIPNPPPAGSKAPRTFTVTLNSPKKLDAQTFAKNLKNMKNLDKKEEFVSAFNLLLSRRTNQDGGKQLIGRDQYFDTTTQDRLVLGSGLEAYFGFSRSVRTGQKSLLLQINTSASAFYQPIQLQKLIDVVWSGKRSQYENEQSQDAHRPAITRFIKGLRVRALYGNPNRFYTVWSLANAESLTDRPTVDTVGFDWVEKDSKGNAKPARRVTVRYYLKNAQAYRKDPRTDITRDNGLVINVGNDAHPTSIPAELLEVRQGNGFRRLLDSNQVTEMVKFATKTATDTANLIVEDGLPMFGVRVEKTDQNTPFHRFGIKIEPTMLQLDARILPGPPYLAYAKQSPSQQGRNRMFTIGPRKVVDDLILAPANAKWDLGDRLFPQGVKAPRYALIEFINRENDKPVLANHRQSFEADLATHIGKLCVSETGVPLRDEPVQKTWVVSDRKDIKQALTTVAKGRDNRKPVDLIFVILPDKNATRYEALKYVADYECGVHTICMVRGSGHEKSPLNNAIIKNLMLKCNLKFGGCNMQVKSSLNQVVSKLLSKTTMIVGADVTHPGPGSMKYCPSIAAVVGSVDTDFSQYPVSLRCQTSKQEMIESLDDMLVERLNRWSELNSKGKKLARPDQIIFYRDGVSEGEYGTVIEKELPLIRNAFSRVYGTKNLPKLLLICVVKRSAARFFPRDLAQTDVNGNCFPGLVVDKEVTHETAHDFYLQSHQSIKGTAKPAHYVVLVDEIKASPDVVQLATYWQCFNFGRCTKAISVHPAARLADRACNRGRAYLREFLVAGDRCEEAFDRNGTAEYAWNGGVHANLKNSMFYM